MSTSLMMGIASPLQLTQRGLSDSARKFINDLYAKPLTLGPKAKGKKNPIRSHVNHAFPPFWTLFNNDRMSIYPPGKCSCLGLMQFYSFLVGLWRLSVYRRCNVF